MSTSDSPSQSSYQTLGRRSSGFFQVTFSDQAMKMLNQLPVDDQLRMVSEMSELNEEALKRHSEKIREFSRDGKTFYRLSAGEFRCYFEVRGSVLYAHYILHQHTIADFLFRNNRPLTDEILAEKEASFWKYLEATIKW
ncbi:MAG: cytotoxic translational repressor of toxin-antitoxin stability system [Verrucomicrobiota bacterium JB022]|nr:cytotoxic translational repressor of toxin-antitoxin stability system [Verrucomicrobiota bacterium JB022]